MGSSTGKSDPIKNLTGTSAMDRAIASTRDMITHMDELLEDFRAELAHEPLDSHAGVERFAGNGTIAAASPTTT